MSFKKIIMPERSKLVLFATFVLLIVIPSYIYRLLYDLGLIDWDKLINIIYILTKLITPFYTIISNSLGWLFSFILPIFTPEILFSVFLPFSFVSLALDIVYYYLISCLIINIWTKKRWRLLVYLVVLILIMMILSYFSHYLYSLDIRTTMSPYYGR